ncbi:MAG TPA: hypothetical protein VLT88_09875 [Desulfosarcina sp.]|nr:hypothetical protein [Desulfosarcina sp.]
MFIPDYQIHNILKEFTQRLKNGNRRPDTGYQMETVVKKVAGNIMRRVVYLSEEEARRRTRSPRHDNRRPRPAIGERPPEPFHYQTIGDDHQKTRHRLTLENSQQLIQRFHSEMEEHTDSDPT